MGGIVNISLKSGTNRLHGTAYWSKRSPAMFAKDYFTNGPDCLQVNLAMTAGADH